MRYGTLSVALLLVVIGAAAFSAESGAANGFDLPQGPNRDLVYAKCRTCHDLQYIVDSAGITRDNWAALVKDMGRYGMRIPTGEQDKIVDYLATYLGPNPPKAAPAAKPAAATVDGKAVYARQCSACHQPEGAGVPKTFPPLAGNPDLFVDPLFPVYVVVNGLEGPLTIKGERYQGVMPPFGHLSDDEVAAVVAYVRAAWNNTKLRPQGFLDVDAAAVKQARLKPMKPKDVHAYRSAHR